MPSKLIPEERHRRRLESYRRHYYKQKAAQASETPEQREVRLARYRASKLEWYRSHKDQARQYYQANQTAILERVRLQAANRTEEEKEAVRLRTKKWHLENPEKALAAGMLRRALKTNSGTGDAKAITAWMKAMRRLKSFTCYHCQETKPRRELCFDHVIPLAKGGPHSLGNLAACCDPCNSSKKARLPHEWMKLKQRSFSL